MPTPPAISELLSSLCNRIFFAVSMAALSIPAAHLCGFLSYGDVSTRLGPLIDLATVAFIAGLWYGFWDQWRTEDKEILAKVQQRPIQGSFLQRAIATSIEVLGQTAFWFVVIQIYNRIYNLIFYHLMNEIARSLLFATFLPLSFGAVIGLWIGALVIPPPTKQD